MQVKQTKKKKKEREQQQQKKKKENRVLQLKSLTSCFNKQFLVPYVQIKQCTSFLLQIHITSAAFLSQYIFPSANKLRLLS